MAYNLRHKQSTRGLEMPPQYIEPWSMVTDDCPLRMIRIRRSWEWKVNKTKATQWSNGNVFSRFNNEKLVSKSKSIDDGLFSTQTMNTSNSQGNKHFFDLFCRSIGKPQAIFCGQTKTCSYFVRPTNSKLSNNICALVSSHHLTIH